MSKSERLRERPCRTCQLDSIQGSLLGDYPELRPVEPWKFGHLFQCSRCGRQWFLHEHKQKISRIQDDLRDLAHHWNRAPLTVDATILAVLAGIGGVTDYYRDQIAIPCSLRHVSGHRYEKAIVLVSRQPPCFWYEPGKVHWAGEVDRVDASAYALPLDVRMACENKSEESMGFAPVGIVDKGGNEYTLVSKSHFFDWRGILGEDIRLSGRQQKWRKRVYPEPAEAYFFVDWFEGCEQMLFGAGLAGLGGG
jgi:hypothetical protein